MSLEDGHQRFKHTPRNVTLSDGSTVNISTDEGANVFLRDENSGCDVFISSTLKKIKKICNEKRLNCNEKAMLKEGWAFLSAFAIHADRDLFRAKIPRTEIQFWLEHIIDDLKK
ncbi:unnamed protein product [Cylindrotheca closterium]|uniref:Uncharacterized protein n=1 Tax=Cylindrotheca closterium TaxID=2856 RepID=A0AAD2CSA1_9STRA|nr:unnamed protein product [Cylindrotheca closterium]